VTPESRPTRGRASALRRAAVAPLLIGCALLGCGPEASETPASAALSSSTASAPFAPTRPAATRVMEPPILGLGDVAVAELAVVTPAGARVLPQHQKEVEGLWLLDREEDVQEVGAGRWLHRTRFRVRAREVGLHEWPAGSIEIENADGDAERIEVPALQFEVASTVAALPARDRPFGPLGVDARGGGFSAGSFAAGAAAAATCLALVGLARRRRAAKENDSSSAVGTAASPDVGIDLDEYTRREIERIRAGAGDDALVAANRASVLLRGYVEQRFRVEALHKTREQLAEIHVPLAAKRSWPELMRILRNLDELRFRPAHGAPSQSLASLEACLRDIETFAAARKPRG